MARRTTTIKRIDPWSVLKFGLIANVAFLLIVLLGFAIVWFFVQRLGLIDQVCGIATEVGFEKCGINGGNLFRAVFLLGLLAVVIQTGLMVFLAFLYNLIADLVGGIKLTIQDDAPVAAVVPGRGTGGAPLNTSQRQAPTAAARPSSPSPSQQSAQQRPAASSPSSSSTPRQPRPASTDHSAATRSPEPSSPAPSSSGGSASTDSPSDRPMGQPMNAPVRPETQTPSQPPSSTTPGSPDAASGPSGGPPFRNDDLFGTPGPGKNPSP